MEPRECIEEYFRACSESTAAEIASHFETNAVIYDTNIKPMEGAEEIGRSWVKVRERWGGARWTVDSCVSDGDVAAIEWSMTGTRPISMQATATSAAFVFRGSEHYRFSERRFSEHRSSEHQLLIAEIRQYWTFDPETLDTGLQGFAYS